MNGLIQPLEKTGEQQTGVSRQAQNVSCNESNLRISIRGATSQAYRLADDPADHRGVLSWHAQPRDRKLYEAGTFGDLIRIPVSSAVLKAAQQRGYLEVRLEADNGLAIYGVRFGRYPVNPSLVVRMK